MWRGRKEGRSVAFAAALPVRLRAWRELRLTDLASTNGTFVNGEELAAKSVALRKYDLITLGESTDLIILSPRIAKKYLRQRLCCHEAKKHQK